MDFAQNDVDFMASNILFVKLLYSVAILFSRIDVLLMQRKIFKPVSINQLDQVVCRMSFLLLQLLSRYGISEIMSLKSSRSLLNEFIYHIPYFQQLFRYQLLISLLSQICKLNQFQYLEFEQKYYFEITTSRKLLSEEIWHIQQLIQIFLR